jgi:hypothetical protein
VGSSFFAIVECSLAVKISATNLMEADLLIKGTKHLSVTISVCAQGSTWELDEHQSVLVACQSQTREHSQAPMTQASTWMGERDMTCSAE